MSDLYANAVRFRNLFRGLATAYGTGRGQWIKHPPGPEVWVDHLAGRGPGLGIAPLMPTNTVWFAAIDLDEPDFKAAALMQSLIPGPSFIERTRSGNVHVWVFFESPCPAWVAMGVLREVCIAADKPHTEVFPKNPDFSKVRLGNYINLPYYGKDRPILAGTASLFLEDFIDNAENIKNDPRRWEQRADLMQIQDPSQRSREGREFGTQASLHMCAEYIVANAETNPLVYGHQSNTMFLLAKQFSNCRMYTHDEALEFMRYVNKYADPGLPDSEIQRILRNAEEKQYTSTGCDDPVVAPYVHPDCPIANPRR